MKTNQPLQLTGPVYVTATRDQLYDDLGAILMAAAMAASERRGWFHLALSGGSTPEPLYMRLVIDPRYRDLSWDKTHIWIVDERRVPEDDDRSNFKMIREALVDHIDIRRRQVHPMPALADDAAERYEQELRAIIESHEPTPRLDFVILGMGDDAHTASLFPGSPALNEKSKLVAVNSGPAVTPPDRVTMTYPLLNAARQVAVLVTGANKAATIRRVDQQMRDGNPDPQTLAITGVNPAAKSNGELTWYLDAEAAGWAE